MTSDSHDRQPQRISAIPVRYAMLLGQYIRNKKEFEAKEAKESNQYLKNLLMGRKQVPHVLPPEKKVGLMAGTIDFFGKTVDGGGEGVWEALSALDAATLAAFVQINKINLLRIDRERLLRRSGAVLIVGLGIVVSLDKLNIFSDPIVRRVSKRFGETMLAQWWAWLLLLVVLFILEIFLWGPGKSRVDEFGQMLDVAFAYVSKLPTPQRDKPVSAIRT
jgi:hypothetical protein